MESLFLYIGPGLGVATIVIVIIVLLIILASIVMLILSPIKSFLKKIKQFFTKKK